eukprot:Pgem_evm1s3632
MTALNLRKENVNLLNNENQLVISYNRVGRSRSRSSVIVITDLPALVLRHILHYISVYRDIYSVLCSCKTLMTCILKCDLYSLRFRSKERKKKNTEKLTSEFIYMEPNLGLSVLGLELSYCWRLKDISLLKKFNNIRLLDLSWCKQLENIDCLIHLKTLKVLMLNG